MATTESPATFDKRLDAIPALSGGPRQVEDLPGGLTNHNYKVTTPSGVFVVRHFEGDVSLLGIDRDAEHANTIRAWQAGVGPEVIAYHPELDMMVIEYVDGITFDNGSFDADRVLSRVADACRALHGGPRFVGDFDMFERQQGYLSIVRERGFALPERYDEFATEFARVREALAVRAEVSVPCNNDLLAGNIIDDGSRLWLIDYEYAGNNDACFELGNTCTECDLDLDQLEELVTAYFGRRLRSKIARTRLQSLASQYGWTLWGVIQAATSDIDYDYEAWAAERYEKAVEGFTSADFAALLDEVQRDD
jgi:thiamine kinase-like enzyme